MDHMAQENRPATDNGFSFAESPISASPLQQLTNQSARIDRLINDINEQLMRIREGEQPQPAQDKVGLAPGLDLNPQRGLPDLAISVKVHANRLEDVLGQLRGF